MAAMRYATVSIPSNLSYPTARTTGSAAVQALPRGTGLDKDVEKYVCGVVVRMAVMAVVTAAIVKTSSVQNSSRCTIVNAQGPLGSGTEQLYIYTLCFRGSSHVLQGGVRAVESLGSFRPQVLLPHSCTHSPSKLPVSVVTQKQPLHKPPWELL